MKKRNYTGDFHAELMSKIAAQLQKANSPPPTTPAPQKDEKSTREKEDSFTFPDAIKLVKITARNL